MPKATRVTVGEAEPWNQYVLECGKDEDLRQDVFELAAANRWIVRELRMEKKSLEDIFVSLTRGEAEGGAP